MKVVWAISALNELRAIYGYYLEHVGYQMAENIRLNVLKATRQLTVEPHSGKPEPELSTTEKQYRSLVRGHYKVVYRVEVETVHIVDVFDTRQNPPKMHRHV